MSAALYIQCSVRLFLTERGKLSLVSTKRLSIEFINIIKTLNLLKHNMQELACFVCGVVTNIYCKDVTSLRSKHTETNVLTYLEKFVGHDLSVDVNHVNRSNSQSVVCQNCIIKIDEYDELYMNAMTLEDDLRTILLKTLEKRCDVVIDDATDFADDAEEDVCEEIDEVTAEKTPPKLPSMFCNICKRNFER